MRLSPGLTPVLLGAVLAGCSADPATVQSSGALSESDPDGITAFHNEQAVLAAEAAVSITTAVVTVDASTKPAVIAAMAPPTSGVPGETPAAMQGTFWMRGNPLPDYLISFSNMQWTSVNETPYGFLSTFSPGSFAWKEKAVAQGAAAGDFTYVPEICRVPADDPTMLEIAYNPSTYDSTTYTRPIADDLAELTGTAAATGSVTDDAANGFIQSIWTTGQLALDGPQSVGLLSDAQIFYEAQFSPDYTQASVIVMGLVAGPFLPITLRVPAPESIASFSLAPHLSDPDVYVRKSYIAGLSKIPDYYLLTRIIDGNGRATPHYAEFLECVMQRSAGRIVQVEAR